MAGQDTDSTSTANAPFVTGKRSMRVRIYRPDDPLTHGFLDTLASIIGEFAQNRWLLGLLLWRDVTAFYKQSLLGMFWIVVFPLVTIGSFMVLRNAGVIHSAQDTVPYSVFAALGVITWQLFAQGLVAGTRALAANESILTRIHCSKKILVVAAFGRAWFTYVVGCIAVNLLMLGHVIHGWDYHLPMAALLFPFAALPLIAMTMAIALIVSLLNALTRDVAAAVSMLMPFALLITPILYTAAPSSDPSPTILAFRRLTTDLNPLFHLTTAPRDLVLHGELSYPTQFAWSSMAALFSLLIAIYAFHLAESRVIERI